MFEKGSSADSAGANENCDQSYARAEAALKAGDAGMAVAILDQVLSEAYGFTLAWHLYGLAQEALGHHEDAASAWRQCLALDPDDRCGAGLDLARLGALPAIEARTEGFAGALYDACAERFDSELVEALHYHAPVLLKAALARHCTAAGRPFRFATVYDLGCGTGLMGAAIRAETGFLAGCDLSPPMLARAQAKRRGGEPLYDKLAHAGLTAFLASRPDASADLVVAADVFVHLGDLAPAFWQSARVLKPGGLIAFTVQSHDGEGVAIGQDRRFAHGEDWLREQLGTAGLRAVLVEAYSARQEGGAAVPGLLVLAER